MNTLGDDSSTAGHYAFVHESVGATEILYVFGDIDLASVDAFDDAIRCAERPRRALLIDLEGCDYIGAAGFAVLVRIYRRLGSGLRVAVSADGIPARLFSLFPGQLPFYHSASLDASLDVAGSGRQRSASRT